MACDQPECFDDPEHNVAFVDWLATWIDQDVRPPSSFLDLSGGAGTLARHLIRQGMTGRLEHHPLDEDARVEVGERVGLVLVWRRFTHLLSHGQQRALLGWIHDILSVEGVVVIAIPDFWHWALRCGLWQNRRTGVRPEDGSELLARVDARRDLVHWTVANNRSPALRHTDRLVTRGELEYLLCEAGFCPSASASPHGPWIAVCGRKEANSAVYDGRLTEASSVEQHEDEACYYDDPEFYVVDNEGEIDVGSGLTGHVERAIRRAFLAAQRAVIDVLDVSAGTGAQVIPLAREGFRVHARDQSRTMVDHLRKRLHEMQLTVPVHQGSMTDLDVHEQYDAIICHWAFCHLLTGAGQSAALAGFWRALRRGGVLSVCVENYWLDRDHLVTGEPERERYLVAGAWHETCVLGELDSFCARRTERGHITASVSDGHAAERRYYYTERVSSLSEVLLRARSVGFTTKVRQQGVAFVITCLKPR